MANELKHSATLHGTTLRRLDWEDINVHVLESQATGDMIHASSPTQLERLAITNDRILVSSGGLPIWSATLPAFTLGGTVTMNSQQFSGEAAFYNAIIGTTTTTLDLRGRRTNHDNAFAIYTPGAAAGYADTLRLLILGRAAEVAVAWSNCNHTGLKLGGALDANSQALTDVSQIIFNSTGPIHRDVFNSILWIRGGTNSAGKGASMHLDGADYGAPGAFRLFTPNAAKNADVARFNISGVLATAVATWLDITHTGIVLSGPLDVAGQYLTLLERAAPGAGAANEARLYAHLVDGGKTELCVIFQTGAVQVLATEP